MSHVQHRWPGGRLESGARNTPVHRVSLCLKNDTDVAYYNFDAHQPILVIFGRDVAERVCCFVIPPLLTNVSALPGETWTSEVCMYSRVPVMIIFFSFHGGVYPLECFLVDNTVTTMLIVLCAVWCTRTFGITGGFWGSPAIIHDYVAWWSTAQAWYVQLILAAEC